MVLFRSGGCTLDCVSCPGLLLQGILSLAQAWGVLQCFPREAIRYLVAGGQPGMGGGESSCL